MGTSSNVNGWLASGEAFGGFDKVIAAPVHKTTSNKAPPPKKMSAIVTHDKPRGFCRM
jgi:hypothetical protein